MTMERDLTTRVTALHDVDCDRVFTSERGKQDGGFGFLMCACWKVMPYQVPVK